MVLHLCEKVEKDEASFVLSNMSYSGLI